MIKLEVYGEAATMASVARLLDAQGDVSRVRLSDATRAGHALVLASVEPRAVDGLLTDLHGLGIADRDITLLREEALGRASGGGDEAGLVWEDVLGLAARNARPIARYVAFMLVAGVIAGYGVVEYNVILIVGAMAISPDMLPITAIGVGLVDRRTRLALRAFATLVIGMAGASAAAAATTFAQNWFGVIPQKFDIDATVLGSLTEVNNETIVVALAAGVAGMLALETRASSGVGVAVSVTTIPAAAYLGVAAGLGQRGEALGALAVLGTNVAMLVIASSATLIVQRRMARRGAARGHRARDGGAGPPAVDPPAPAGQVGP